VRIVIASDLHANQEALAVLPREYDQLWILGDIVNYGPNPAEVVDFVCQHATHALKGNHDHAIAFREDARCHGRFRELAEVTGRFTETALQDAHRKYLRDLPLQVELEVGRTRFRLCHALPSDPHFGYAPANSERWAGEVGHLPIDILLVGHTHTQFIKKVGNCLVLNPGSLGQPDNRSGLACYAVWESGIISVRSTLYDVETTVAKVQAAAGLDAVREDLVTLLRHGRLTESDVSDAPATVSMT
jgi:putative phosphoesterase